MIVRLLRRTPLWTVTVLVAVLCRQVVAWLTAGHRPRGVTRGGAVRGRRCVGIVLGTALVTATGPLLTPAPAAAAPAPAGSGLTGADPVAARAVAPVATVPNPVSAAPGPEAPPAPWRAPSPVTRAVEKARAAGAPVPVQELTTDRAVTTAGADGQLTTEVSTRPVRFKDAAGSWRDLDLTLAPNAAGLRPRAAPPAAPGLPALTGPGSVVSSGTGPSAFTWGPADALKVMPAVGGGGAAGTPATARLAAALPGGRDVQLQLGADTVSESVVLKDRLTATAYPGYTDVFTVPAGATARQTPSGVEFVDTTGTVLGSFGGGHAFDSLSTPDSDEAATAPVSTRLLSQVGRTVTVSVGVDAAWLAAPARVFPVTIDPEFNAAAATQYDTYLDAANPTTAEGGSDPGVLKAGWRAPTSGAGLAETRSLVFFPLPDELSNAARRQNNVLSAQLSLFTNHSYTCGATPAVQVRPNAQGWSAAGATWNNKPGTVNTVTAGTFAYGYSSSCPANWARLDVQPQAQGWSAGSFTNYGLQLQTATSDAYGYKRFAPADAGGATAPTLRIVWENCTTIAGGPNGPHKVCGAIRDKYRQLGGTAWGYPTNDESPTADGQGAFNHFAAPGQTAESASIFWHPTTGPHVVRFAIRTRWLALGADRPGGPGYPETDEQSEVFGGSSGRFYVPANGSRTDITWGSAYGAWEIRGAIRDRWLALGDISGVGFARTGDTVVTGGAYNIFAYPNQLDQSIAWTPSTGAHRTRGVIRQAWLAEGDRTGWLGYPLDDEQTIAGGARSEFQGGTATFDNQTNRASTTAGDIGLPVAGQVVSQTRTRLNAIAKTTTTSDYDAVTFEWSLHRQGQAPVWSDVPRTDLATVDDEVLTTTALPVVPRTVDATATRPAYTGAASTDYIWDATRTVTTDDFVDVRASFHAKGTGTRRYTTVTTISVVQGDTLSSSFLTQAGVDQPTGRTYVSGTTPAFTAASSDRSGASIRADFEIWADEALQLEPVAAGQTESMASGQAGSWTASDAAALEYGHAYKWHVRSNNGSSFSPWSDFRYFDISADPATIPGLPSNVTADALSDSPEPIMALLRPTLSAMTPAGIGDYQVDFELRADGTDELLASGRSAPTVGEHEASWQPTAPVLTDGQAGYLRARTFDGLHTSGWSLPRSFLVHAPANTPPTIPTGLTAQPDINTSSATMPSTNFLANTTDADSDGVTIDYEVQGTDGSLVTSGEGEALTTQATTAPLSYTTTASWRAPANVLAAGATYLVRMRANDGRSYSPWSATTQVTVQAGTVYDPNQPPRAFIRPGDGGTTCSITDYQQNLGKSCWNGRTERHPVTTPMGWQLFGHYNDNCSHSPDKPRGFNFIPACQTHDYGYALVRAGTFANNFDNKLEVDNNFLNSLVYGTCPRYKHVLTCRSIASTYFGVVRIPSRI